MKNYIVGILTIMLFIVGCDTNKEVSKIDCTEIMRYNIGTLFYTEWNGHRYVCRSDFHNGGITHDPDCPYCKNRDK